MEKIFVQYPNFRSSTYKYDPCVESKNALACADCRVQIISDRFLGRRFMREVMHGRLNYPYVLIADTAGCNMTCWFCYSWQFWSVKQAEELGCQPVFIAPERLAEQFSCKFELLSDKTSLIDTVKKKPFLTEKERNQAVKHIDRQYPVRGIRISGGEPLCATQNLVRPYTSDSTVDYSLSLQYWLTFFEAFDNVVDQIKTQKLIHPIDCSKWTWSHPFPSVLTEAEGRLHVRFDTNGIAFGDHEFCHQRAGDRGIASSFVKGIYRLFEQGKLENLQIMIDYSFKGATPMEFYWSQRMQLPVESQKNATGFALSDHPQYGGFHYLHDAVRQCVDHDPGFADCVYLSVEKGIENGRNGKFILNHVGSMDWSRLETRLGITFSEVSNEIDVANPWRYEAQIYRYLKQHANARMVASTHEYSADSHIDGPRGLIEFIRTHRKASDFHFIMFPASPQDTQVPKLRKVTQKRPCLTISSTKPVHGWVFTGNRENWEIALEKGVWGVGPGLKSLWEHMKHGDIVFFYVTRPISGIVGMGMIEATVEKRTLLWPNELQQNKVKYPYRIKLLINQLIPLDEWREKRFSIQNLQVPYYRGANAITNADAVNVMIAYFKAK